MKLEREREKEESICIRHHCVCQMWCMTLAYSTAGKFGRGNSEQNGEKERLNSEQERMDQELCGEGERERREEEKEEEEKEEKEEALLEYVRQIAFIVEVAVFLTQVSFSNFGTYRAIFILFCIINMSS